MRHLREGMRDRFGDAQRGATVTQYAVAVVLIAIVAIVSVQQLGREGSNTFEDANGGVERGQAPSPPPWGGTGGSSGSGGSGGSGSGGSGSGGSGSSGGGSTVTSSIPVPTTSTTLPPITTTSTTTTTTAPVVVAAASFSATDAVYVSWSSWRAEASVVVRNASGQPIPGATVQLTVRMRNYYGQWTQSTVTLTANANGMVSYNSGTLVRSGTSRIEDVELTVYSVSGSDGLQWDGSAPYANIDRP